MGKIKTRTLHKGGRIVTRLLLGFSLTKFLGPNNDSIIFSKENFFNFHCLDYSS